MAVKVIKKPVAGVNPDPAPAPVIDMQKGVEETPPTPAPLKMVKGASVQGHVVQGTVEKHYSSGGSDSTSEVVGEVKTDQPTCNVGVSMSFTKNLGNYESLKVSVSLFAPCTPTAEDIEATYEQVKGGVDGKVSEVQAEISDQVGH